MEVVYYKKIRKGCGKNAEYQTHFRFEKLYGSFKNGRGEYVILDMKEYDKMRATISLMSQLETGEHSARKEGWLSADEVEKTLGL